MADPVLGVGVKTVGGMVKNLVVDKIVEYVKFINSYEGNMGELRKELQDLCDKKLDLEERVRKGKQSLQVMTRQTTRWLEVVINMIMGGDIRELMKDEKVTEIVVKMMDRRVLKNLWKEDREVFDIVVGVVKKKCSHHQHADDEVVDAEEDADYKKVAKIAIEVMKDAAEEFTKFIKTDAHAAAAVVKLLSDEDLTKLAKDGDDMALILSKAEGINRKKIEHNDDEEESLLPKQQSEDVQPCDSNIVKDKVWSLRKRMGSLMSFLDDEKFKKGLPDAALLGLEVLGALSNSSGPAQEAEQNGGKPHRHCGWNVIRCDFYRHRHDMSLMSVAMVTEVKSMISKYPSDPVTRDRRDDELESIPGEFVQGLESREALLWKILTALNDDKVNVVGVYGMGGCGKTTLAKEVANKRAGDLFDKRIVVEVSEAPNIKSIQDQIAGLIGLIWKDMQQSVAQRARALYNRLKSEKILIILDNVWKKLKLDEVGIPHRENNKDFFCKLLITTRDRQVCSRDMDVQEANIFEVGLLNEREALNLFENQLEKKVESEDEFKLVADRLLRKCGGLPLAIDTTASALKGKNLAMWNHFAEISEKPISSQVSSEYRETYSILETSYKLIDIEEKRTFLFLACLSPLDSAVAVEDLMRYGIGLDLFQRVNSLSDAMEQANNWANELISSSLLLEGDSDDEVKIHDLVRASTIAFIDKGKDRMTLVESIPRWMCEETFEKFTAISLMSGHDFSQLSGVIAPKLEILLLKGDISSTTLPSNFFVGMKKLKVLSLSNVNFISGLPESMGLLERLKTLHLHYCKLKDVKLIGKLANLLVLSLRGSNLKELDIEIGELCKLRLLDLGGCKGLDRIPANILSRFSYLEGLYMLNSFDGWASTTNNDDIEEVIDGGGSNQQQAIISGRELDKLSHLNVLEMEVSEAEQLLTVNTDQFVQQLSKFRVRVCNSSKLDMVDDVYVSTFPYVLELAEIDPSQSIWLKALLKKSQCLLVRDCGSHDGNLVPLFEGDGFNDLRYLLVEKCEFKCIVSRSNEEDDDESMTTTFAKLKSLTVKYMKRIEMICDGKAPAGMFSNLQRLSFDDLSHLKYGLPLTFASLNLMTEIFIQYCDSLEFIVSMEDASVTENETYIDLFPHLRSLVLTHVESLSSVLRQSRNDKLFTIENDEVADHALFSTESKYLYLEYLELSFAGAIATLWSKTCYVSSFQGLKVLRVKFCYKLRSLGSPCIFAALVQLEELEISICPNLQEVITKEMEEDEVGEHVIKFPSLKRLILDDLDKLERFYGGSYRLEFPNLKSLTLLDAKKMTIFDGSEDSTALFSDEIEFPSLEELEVSRVSNEVLRLWNWSSSSEGGSSNSSNPVPNLKQLRVGQVHGLTSIPPFISHKLSHLEVKNFDDIETLFSSVVVPPLNREVFWTYSQFPTLEDLSVSYCDSLEQLFENEDDEDALMLCESLTGIKLDNLEALKIFPLQLFANICTLRLNRLLWEYVFSADLFIKGKEQLQQLEVLDIGGCHYLEVIIMDEVVGDDEDRVYCFPRLKTLSLSGTSITNFASKPNIGLHFPSLEGIEITVCDDIQSFWSGPFMAPKLKKVRLSDCNLKSFLSNTVDEVGELPSLESLLICRCPRLLSFSSEPLVTPKLQSVKCEYCPKMKWLILGDPNKGGILELPSLESVEIIDCWDLQSFSSGKTKAPNLCELKVDYVDYSKRSNEGLEHLLDTFKDIVVIRPAGRNDDDSDDSNGY